jgi:hypothetical protein
VTIYSEYHPHDLEQELKKRKQSLEYFSEPEVWYLIDSLVSLGFHL